MSDRTARLILAHLDPNDMAIAVTMARLKNPTDLNDNANLARVADSIDQHNRAIQIWEDANPWP